MTDLTTTATLSDAVDRAVQRLREATRRQVPCAPVRDLIGGDDVDAAYAVQRLLNKQRTTAGATVIGRKIGLTAPAVQQQLGVDQPDFGVLFDDMRCTQDVPVDIGRLLQPKIEAEIAFVLGADLDDPAADAQSVRTAVDHAVPALEIVDSRIEGWDITFGDTVADNASSGLFVLGHRRLTLDEFAPIDVEMTMTRDGEPVSAGRGDACLGNPLIALAWLAATAARLGDPLRAGDVVLSGALGPMVEVRPGSSFSAELGPLGEVSATFTTG
jgi:2-keto-4-pentenoate hydratase